MTLSLHDIARARLDAISYRRMQSDLRADALRRRQGQPLWNLCARHAYAAGFTVEEFQGRGRTQDIAHPRQDFMTAAHDKGFSVSQIGRFLSRDHTTILYGIRAARFRAKGADQ